MKNFEKFAKTSLSKEEMKNVKGGKVECDCKCEGIPGAWHGSYPDYDSVSDRAWANCGDGGWSCTCSGPPSAS